VIYKWGGYLIRAVSPTSQPSHDHRRSARERSHPTYGSVTHLVIRFNPGFESRSFLLPSQPRASFTISANFILPSSAIIEIHRWISHKLKSLMGIHSRSFPSSRQTRSVVTATAKKKKYMANASPISYETRQGNRHLRKAHIQRTRVPPPLKGRVSRQCGLLPTGLRYQGDALRSRPVLVGISEASVLA